MIRPSSNLYLKTKGGVGVPENLFNLMFWSNWHVGTGFNLFDVCDDPLPFPLWKKTFSRLLFDWAGISENWILQVFVTLQLNIVYSATNSCEFFSINRFSLVSSFYKAVFSLAAIFPSALLPLCLCSACTRPYPESYQQHSSSANRSVEYCWLLFHLVCSLVQLSVTTCQKQWSGSPASRLY